MEVVKVVGWAFAALWLGVCALVLLTLVLGVVAYAGKGAERLLVALNRLPWLR